MSLIIMADCINCGACEPECPNNAIYNVGEKWSFADGTAARGQFEYKGRMVNADAKLDALSDSIYFIVPEKCTECVGFYDEQKCVSVCPVDCCVEDQNHRESQELLRAKKEKLHPA